MNETLEVRNLTWDEYERYMDEVESTKPAFDEKGNVAGTKSKEEAMHLLEKFQRKAAKWVMDNVYSKFDINKFTPMEVLGIYGATMRCTKVVREDEIKNLRSSLTGSAKEPNTAKAAPKQTRKQAGK